MTLSSAISCGKHSALIEGHILILRFVGSMSMDDWQQIRNLAEQVIAAQGHVYMIGHLEHASSIEPAARAAFVHWMKYGRLLGFANVKAGFMTRALAVMLGNAVRLVMRVPMAISFFEDEKKAREWIDELERKRLRSSPSHPTGP